MVVSCWPEVCTLQIRSEKILMLDCGILILSYLMPSASEIIYICHFSHGFYDGRLRAVCPGSGTLQDWNTEISVIPSGILWSIRLNFEMLFIFASSSKCMVRAGKSLCGGQLFYRILTGIKEMCLFSLDYFISATVLIKTIQRWLHPAGIVQTTEHRSFNHLCATDVCLVMR